MADQLELLQEANARGILPDNMKPLYQEAVARGLIGGQKSDTTSSLATQGERLVGGAGGVVDALAKGVSSIPAGVSGAAGFVKGLLTPGDNAGDTAEDWMNRTSEFMNKPRVTIGTPVAQQAQGYQEGNQGAQQGISAVMNLPGYLAEKGTDALIKGISQPQSQKYQADLAKANAGMQFGTNLAANSLPMMFGPRGAPSVHKTPEITPFSQARDLGLSIPPSYAHGKGGVTTAGPAIEGMVGGAPKTAVEASMKNQPIITSKAAEDIKTLDKTLPVSDETLDAAAQPYYEKYTAVKNLGKSIPIDGQFKNGVASIGQESADAFPMDSSPALEKLKQAYLQPDSFGSNGAVLKIRQLRKDGNLNIASRDPEKMQLGYAQRQIASLIEDQMERYATSRPEGFNAPNVIKDFKDARQQIAKIETLRDSIKPGTNDVSAAYLAKQLNRGVPLSGNMLKIAEAYNNFKPAMQDAGPLRNKVPVNRLDAMVGSAGAGIGAFKHSASPVLGAAGYILAPPLARKALLSDAYQNSMLPKPMNPDILKLIAPLAAQSLFTGNQK